MSTAITTSCPATRISWNDNISQHPLQALSLMTPAFPAALSLNASSLEPTATFYQTTSSGFIDSSSHSSTLFPGPTMPAESSLDDFESDDESASSVTSESSAFSIDGIEEQVRHVVHRQQLFRTAQIVARAQVDDALKQLEEYQRRLSSTNGACHSADEDNSRVQDFIRQHKLDVDMNAITFEQGCAFRKSDFYTKALPYISRFFQARVDMARRSGTHVLPTENCNSPQI